MVCGSVVLPGERASRGWRGRLWRVLVVAVGSLASAAAWGVLLSVFGCAEGASASSERRLDAITAITMTPILGGATAAGDGKGEGEAEDPARAPSSAGTEGDGAEPGAVGSGEGDPGDDDTSSTPAVSPAPEAMPGAVDPTLDDDGDGTVNGLDACPDDANKVRAGACGCGEADDDDDGDGVADCDDACPTDPSKSEDDGCGCNVPDRDGDGVDDCKDECPEDPARDSLGPCGCVGEPDPVDALTACEVSICGGEPSFCDGRGRCGHPDLCNPPADGCSEHSFDGGTYYLCSDPLSWDAAMAACRMAGGTLVVVESQAEHDFLTALGTLGWIGATDAAEQGQWRWVDGSLLSTGAVPAAGVFSDWRDGEPSGEAGADCARAGNAGNWNDDPCGDARAYTCEAR